MKHIKQALLVFFFITLSSSVHAYRWSYGNMNEFMDRCSKPVAAKNSSLPEAKRNKVAFDYCYCMATKLEVKHPYSFVKANHDQLIDELVEANQCR